MMKKLVALLLAALMMVVLVSCTQDEKQSDSPSRVDHGSAAQVLSSVWADFSEDEKFYVWGGDYDTIIENDAGTVQSKDFMTYSLLLPENLYDQVDDVASLIHGMNVNSMTVGMFHLVESADIDAFAQTMRDAIQNKQWMCGFPDELYIANMDGYVLVGFGLTENMSAIQTHFNKLYSNVQVLYQEPIQA